jgi:hypothetical protein
MRAKSLGNGHETGLVGIRRRRPRPAADPAVEVEFFLRRRQLCGAALRFKPLQPRHEILRTILRDAAMTDQHNAFLA